MKKLVSVLALTLLLVSAMGVTVFAHGGHGGHGSHGGGGQATPQHTLCAVEGCAQTGAHQHEGVWYCSVPARGENLCPVEGCTQPGLHQHEGDYYYCQNHGAGAGSGCARGRGR